MNCIDKNTKCQYRDKYDKCVNVETSQPCRASMVAPYKSAIAELVAALESMINRHCAQCPHYCKKTVEDKRRCAYVKEFDILEGYQRHKREEGSDGKSSN